MKNLSDSEEIITVWENITTTANDSLGLMNWSSINLGLLENA